MSTTAVWIYYRSSLGCIDSFSNYQMFSVFPFVQESGYTVIYSKSIVPGTG